MLSDGIRITPCPDITFDGDPLLFSHWVNSSNLKKILIINSRNQLNPIPAIKVIAKFRE